MYRKHYRHHTKTTRSNQFSKVAGYKTIQKLVVFLYTNNKYKKGSVKNNNFLNCTPSKKKILGINQTKEMKDLYTENCKILIKEI